MRYIFVSFLLSLNSRGRGRGRGEAVGHFWAPYACQLCVCVCGTHNKPCFVAFISFRHRCRCLETFFSTPPPTPPPLLLLLILLLLLLLLLRNDLKMLQKQKLSEARRGEARQVASSLQRVAFALCCLQLPFHVVAAVVVGFLFCGAFWLCWSH